MVGMIGTCDGRAASAEAVGGVSGGAEATGGVWKVGGRWVWRGLIVGGGGCGGEGREGSGECGKWSEG